MLIYLKLSVITDQIVACNAKRRWFVKVQCSYKYTQIQHTQVKSNFGQYKVFSGHCGILLVYLTTISNQFLKKQLWIKSSSLCNQLPTVWYLVSHTNTFLSIYKKVAIICLLAHIGFPHARAFRFQFILQSAAPFTKFIWIQLGIYCLQSAMSKIESSCRITRQNTLVSISFAAVVKQNSLMHSCYIQPPWLIIFLWRNVSPTEYLECLPIVYH